MQKSKEIYLDYASATPLDLSVFSVIQKALKQNFANVGSIHNLGIKNLKILEQNRGEVANILGAHSDEIVFTSGATESNNLAILGTVAQYYEIFSHCALPEVPGGTLADKKVHNIVLPHIVTTNIEHSSVLETCRHLEKTKQAEVTYVPVETNGIVDSKKIKKVIKSNTILVSVMYANNEIGTIQPIMEIAKEIRHFKKNTKAKYYEIFSHCALPGVPGGTLADKKFHSISPFPVFHADATQAINYLPVKVEKLGIDLMSLNSGKIYGPKGVGVLYIKRKTPIKKIMFGGEQEFRFRPGTENIPLIVGLTEALKITEKIKEKEVKRLTKLRDYFIKKLESFNFKLNGDLEKRLPNNINITVPKIPSDLLLIELSARGIYVSEKSACKSGEKADSYVIRALHQTPSKICKKLDGSLRFSLGRQTTKNDIDYVLKSLSEILKKLEKWYN